MSGDVTPDHFVMTRDGALNRDRLTVQPFAVVSARDGGTTERPLKLDEDGPPTLGEERLRELAALGADLEERLGGPQDIEWAIEQCELYVLQARPVPG